MTEIELLKALVEQLTGERDRLLDDIERYREDIQRLRGEKQLVSFQTIGAGGPNDAAGPTMTGSSGGTDGGGAAGGWKITAVEVTK